MMPPIVVVTASSGSFTDLAAHLSEIHVGIEQFPLISFEAPTDWTELDAVLADLSRFDAVAFTSPRAGQAVSERMRQRGKAESRDRTLPVWAAGAATAEALGDIFGPVRMPKHSGLASPAAALARAMLDSGCRGRVLFPCGESRRDDLPAILRAGGCEVREVVCYRSVLASHAQASAAAARASILVVASPIVMQLLAASCSRGARPQLIAIGPTTANTAREYGWLPTAVAEQPSSQSVASAITSILVQQNR